MSPVGIGSLVVYKTLIIKDNQKGIKKGISEIEFNTD